MPEDEDVETETLADAIRRLRGDMTQEQFAAHVGISPSMIGHVESGRRSLGVASLERIEEVLDLGRAQRSELRAARDRASQSPSSPAGDDDVLRRVERLERLMLGLSVRLKESLEGDGDLLDLLDALESERTARSRAAR